MRELWPPTASRAAREIVYVVTGLPLGLFWCLVMCGGLAMGLGLSVLLFGIPLLAVLGVTRWGANTERVRAALVLGAPIERPPRPVTEGNWLARWRTRLSDRALWKEVGYLFALGPVGIVSGALAIALWSTVLAALASPAVAAAAPRQSLLGEVSGAGFVAVVAGGLVLACVATGVTHWLAHGCIAMARGLLSADERALLAARVDTLEATRAGAVESADARLRRLERDLHDGAQHRLAYIAMELDRARSRLADDPEGASELLSRAHEESKRAMLELRDLVRGINPSC